MLTADDVKSWKITDPADIPLHWSQLSGHDELLLPFLEKHGMMFTLHMSLSGNVDKLNHIFAVASRHCRPTSVTYNGGQLMLVLMQQFPSHFTMSPQCLERLGDYLTTYARLRDINAPIATQYKEALAAAIDSFKQSATTLDFKKGQVYQHNGLVAGLLNAVINHVHSDCEMDEAFVNSLLMSAANVITHYATLNTNVFIAGDGYDQDLCQDMLSIVELAVDELKEHESLFSLADHAVTLKCVMEVKNMAVAQEQALEPIRLAR